MPAESFEKRFIQKLPKIDPREIESFLGNLVREKKFFNTLLNVMDDGIVVMRPNLEVLFANAAAQELLGLRAHRRLAGQKLSALLTEPTFKEVLGKFALQPHQRVSAELDLTLRGESPTPELRRLQLSLLPVLNAEQDEPLPTAQAEPSAVICVIQDATERLRASEAQRRMERAASLQTLTAGLAHEIKNPLNSLGIHAQLLQRNLPGALEQARGLEPARREQLLHHCEVISEEMERLRSVVDEFLAAVRPSRPLAEPVNVNRLIDEVIRTVEASAEARGASILCYPDNDLPALPVDRNQMFRALLNLLTNALEAVAPLAENCPTGDMASASECAAAGTPTVRIGTSIQGQHWSITVADNGPGIDAETLGKIFEPYFSTKFSGTGLGLVIVRRIVEEHGGEVEISTAPGEGTAFRLVFPLEHRQVRLLGE